jgi:hypothetical protein
MANQQFTEWPKSRLTVYLVASAGLYYVFLTTLRPR